MTVTEYALKFVGRPYVWGGDGSGQYGGGFDCSGLAVECLRAFGLIAQRDYTAQALYTLLKGSWREVPRGFFAEGDVIFWGKDASHISHVSLALGSSLHIEAGGGGSKCKSAEKSTGMVRIRPLTSRSDFVACLRAP